MAFETLVQSGPITILYLPGPAETLILSFASIGPDPQRLPSPEFVGTATDGGRPGLFILDASRSWGQAPELAGAMTQAVETLCKRQTVSGLVGIGQSMGGFAALAAAQTLPMDLVLAFGPQSFLGADEARWRPWSQLVPHPLPMPLAPAEGQRWVLLHSLSDDRDQAMGFAPAPRLDHILFAGLSHSALCPHLKQRGVLKGLLDSALAGDRRRMLRIAASAGGQLRKRMTL